MRRHRRTIRVRPHQTTVWERFGTSLALTGINTLNEAVLASPLSFESNVVDSNWTLRGMRLTFSYAYEMAINVPNCQPLVYVGIYRKGINDATVASPATPTDQDFLDLWQIQFYSESTTALQRTPVYGDAEAERRIKVARKLDQEEAVFLIGTFFNFTAATDTSPVVRLRIGVSNLWSRTKQR